MSNLPPSEPSISCTKNGRKGEMEWRRNTSRYRHRQAARIGHRPGFGAVSIISGRMLSGQLVCRALGPHRPWREADNEAALPVVIPVSKRQCGRCDYRRVIARCAINWSKPCSVTAAPFGRRTCAVYRKTGFTNGAPATAASGFTSPQLRPAVAQVATMH